MPSSSTAQRNYIFYLKGRYQTKDKTPEKDKWIWEKIWEEIKESIKVYRAGVNHPFLKERA